MKAPHPLLALLVLTAALAVSACCKDEEAPPPEPVKVEAEPEEKAPDPSELRSVTGDLRAAFMPTTQGFELAALDPKELLVGDIQECTWTLRTSSGEEKVTLRGSDEFPLKDAKTGICRTHNKRFSTTEWPSKGAVLATVEVQMESKVITGTSIFRLGVDLPTPGGLGAAAQGAGWKDVSGELAEELQAGVGYQRRPFRISPEDDEARVVDGALLYGVLPKGDYTACANRKGERMCCFPEEVKRESGDLTLIKTACDLGPDNGVCCTRTDNQALELHYTSDQKKDEAELKKLIKELAKRLP